MRVLHGPQRLDGERGRHHGLRQTSHCAGRQARKAILMIESVVTYDKVARQAAVSDGMDTLKEVDSTLVMKHLGYDAAVAIFSD